MAVIFGNIINNIFAIKCKLLKQKKAESCRTNDQGDANYDNDNLRPLVQLKGILTKTSRRAM